MNQASFKNSLFLFALLIISTLLSLHHLGQKSIWYDEACSISYAHQHFNTLLYPPFLMRPVYFLILKLWNTLFGHTEYVLRLLSVLFSIGSVWLVFTITKQLFSKKISYYAITLFAFSGYRILLSQQIRNYSLLLFLCLLSTYYLIRFVQSLKTRDLVFYILFSLLALYTQPFALFLFFAHTLYATHNKKQFLIMKKKWVISQFILLFAFIPLVYLYFQPSLAPLLLSVPKSHQTLQTLFNTLQAFSYGGPFIAQAATAYPLSQNKLFFLYFSSFVFYSVILFAMIKSYVNKQKNSTQFNRSIVFVILWAFLPILLLYGISFKKPTLYKTRYIIYSLPALIILFSIGIQYIRNIILRTIIAMIVILGCIFFIHNYYHIDTLFEGNSAREASLYMKEHLKKDDTLLFLPAEQVPVFLYYLNYTTHFPLGTIGTANAHNVFFYNNTWHTHKYVPSENSIYSIGFNDIFYISLLEWEQSFRTYLKNNPLLRKGNTFLVISPSWITQEKAKVVKTILEETHTIISDSSYPFDGIRVLYFEKNKTTRH